MDDKDGGKEGRSIRQDGMSKGMREKRQEGGKKGPKYPK